MSSQQSSLTKMSGSYPIQILPPTTGNLSRGTVNMPIQLLNHNPSLNLPMRTSGGSLLSDQTAPGLPLQIPTTSVNVPMQMPSSSSTNVPVHPKKSAVTNSNLSGSTLLTAQMASLKSSNSIIQLQLPNPQNIGKLDKSVNCSGDNAEKVNQSIARNAASLKQDQGSSSKIQETMTLSQISGGQYHIANSNNGAPVQLQVSPSNNSVQVRVGARGPPVLYIQTPTGLKPATEAIVNSAAASHPQIILRRSQSSTSIPLATRKVVNVSNKSVNKGSVLASKSNHPFVVQSPKLPQNMVPVSVASSVNGKNHLNAFLNPMKKSIPATSQDNQTVLTSAPHLSIPTSSSQKLLLTSMNLSKIPNTKLYLPVGVPPKNSLINFQISNGQIQNDTHGKVTVMGDINSLSGTVSEVPPLQPFSKSISLSNNVAVTSSASLTQKSNSGLDKTPLPIPGTRVEPISEHEYTLSIPESDVSINDDMYTVSISNGNDANRVMEKSFTIPIPEKGKSLLCKGTTMDGLSSFVPGPAILRRSNSDSIEKKNNARRRLSACTDNNVENANSKQDARKLDKSLLISGIGKMNSGEQSRVPSLFCDEEIDMDVELKPIPFLVNSHVNKDRRKSRVSSDIHHMLESIPEKNGVSSYSNNQDKSLLLSKQQLKQSIDYPVDAPGLRWNNGVAILPGSSLQFRLNEFGIIDVLDTTLSEKRFINSKYFADYKGYDKKSVSPDDFYRCEECGCHGMAAEFVTPNFCSESCQKTFEKSSKYKNNRPVMDVKKKRKQKKAIAQKRPGKEQNDMNTNEDEFNELEIRKKYFDIKKTEPKATEKKPLEERSNVLENVKTDEPTPVQPWLCTKSGFSWMKYLDYCKAIAAPSKYFRESCVKNGFKKGMKLEAVDPVHPSIYAVVTVTEIQGHRLRLHFDGYHEDYDFWVNANSCDIFPPGWCEKNKRTLRLPSGFDQDNFSWSLYIRQSKAVAAPKHLFSHLSENSCPTGFRIGMKLEAEDRKNALTCVATVSDIVNNRVLIHFDSWDDIYDYWVDPTSPYIHPVGWCDEKGFGLTPPHSYKDPENFTWDQYLLETDSTAVPSRSFKPRLPHKFKVGMKLEAVDKRAPFLIRVATITDVKSHQIRISFDGWSDELSYWVDDDCPDIHPVGWCLKTGHLLESPLTSKDLQTIGECGTIGCYGLGNSRSAKNSTHYTSAECPYRLPAVSPVHRDRLDGVRPPPQLSEPRPREPRKVSNTIKITDMEADCEDRNDECTDELIDESISYERAPKRKQDDEIKSELGSDEDSSSISKRRRDLSPSSKQDIEYSVYDPGYLPNPNRVLPPGWRDDFFSLKDILSKESLRVDPRNWNQSDVLRFVEHIAKCREFSWKFSRHRIDGESFLMLSQEDLVSIIGMKLGPAIKVYNSIIQLRQKILS